MKVFVKISPSSIPIFLGGFAPEPSKVLTTKNLDPPFSLALGQMFARFDCTSISTLKIVWLAKLYTGKDRDPNAVNYLDSAVFNNQVLY